MIDVGGTYDCDLETNIYNTISTDNDPIFSMGLRQTRFDLSNHVSMILWMELEA